MCTSTNDNKLSFLQDKNFRWFDIDWKVINREVIRLRRRIFRTARQGNRKRLRDLQRLLLSSDSNLLYSIRRVTYGSGSETPGIDGITYRTPESRIRLFQEVRTSEIKTYNPIPVKRIYIPKPDGRLRPLGIPTIKDRVLQMVVKNALEPAWEAQFEGSSYGFRPSRSVNDAINRIYVSLNKAGSRSWVVDADISQCFDNI